MSSTAKMALVLSASASVALGQTLKGGSGGGLVCPVPGQPRWGNPGTYCLADGNLYNCNGGTYATGMVQNCGGNGCQYAANGYPDYCNAPPSQPVCPVGWAWGNPGLYCLQGDLYQCNAPGAYAAYRAQTCAYGCHVAAPGHPDFCY